MKKRMVITAMIVAATMTLTACASIPNMTEEQTELVSEYATALLLKYDKENHSRLTDTSEFMNSYILAMQQYNLSKELYETAKEEGYLDEEQRREETKQQEEANAEYNADTSSGDKESENSETVGRPYNDGTGGATVISAASVNSYLGLEDFSFDYSGYRTMKTYPDNNSNDVFFVINATEGNDLLVIYFDVTNKSGADAKLDIYNKEAKFKIGVNGGTEKTAFKTMLEDDLSEYLGNFSKGETKQLVLLLEVKEGTQVDNITLSVSLSGKDSIKKILK